jgi:phosphoribosylformylglycinamidine (FGAM) synthase-like amidotransferase family enzyme
LEKYQNKPAETDNRRSTSVDDETQQVSYDIYDNGSANRITGINSGEGNESIFHA